MGKKIYLMLGMPVTTCMVAVAGDVFGGILFCAVIFPRDVLDEIWD